MGRGHPLFLARTLLGQAVSSQGKSSASMLGNLNRTLNREGLVRRWRERRRFEKPTIRNQRIEFERCSGIRQREMVRKHAIIIQRR